MGTSKGYIAPTTIEWSKAKRAVTKLIDMPCSENIKELVSRYTEAMKKSRVSEKVFSKSVSNIIELSRSINVIGIDDTLSKLGREDLIGKSNDEIFNELLYYFTNNGAQTEDSLAIDALSKTLKNLNIEDIDELKNLNEEIFLKEVIYEFTELSFEFRFFEKISKSKTPTETKDILNDLKGYLKGVIYEQLKVEDISSINFADLAGESYVTNLCDQTFKLFIDLYEGDN